MDTKEKVVKKDVGSFSKSFIVIELLVLYLTLRICDTISISINSDNSILTRYIPIAIVAFISVFLIATQKLKGYIKAEFNNVKAVAKVLPIVVALILLFYGLFSVASNMRSIREKVDNSIYSAFYDELNMKELLDEAAKNARITWIITSITYLIVAEASTIIALKKAEENVIEDSENEILVSNSQENIETAQEENNEEKNSQNDNEIKEKIDSIKWDL